MFFLPFTMQSTCSHNQMNAQNKIWFTRNLSHFECSTSFIALFEMKHDLLAFAKCKHEINYSCLQQLMVHWGIDAYSYIWWLVCVTLYRLWRLCFYIVTNIHSKRIYDDSLHQPSSNFFFYHWTVLYWLRLSWLIKGFLKHFA